MNTTQQESQFEAIESLLNKDSKAFDNVADGDLQKQIMAAVEREVSGEEFGKPALKKSFNWLFSSLSIAAVATFFAIAVVPQWISKNDTNDPVFAKFSINKEIHKVTENIEKVEVASLNTMTSEKEALEKDIKSILKAFSIGK